MCCCLERSNYKWVCPWPWWWSTGKIDLMIPSLLTKVLEDEADQWGMDGDTSSCSRWQFCCEGCSSVVRLVCVWVANYACIISFWGLLVPHGKPWLAAGFVVLNIFFLCLNDEICAKHGRGKRLTTLLFLYLQLERNLFMLSTLCISGFVHVYLKCFFWGAL